MTSASVNKNDPRTEKPISKYLKLDKNVIEPQKFAKKTKLDIIFSKHQLSTEVYKILFTSKVFLVFLMLFNLLSNTLLKDA